MLIVITRYFLVKKFLYCIFLHYYNIIVVVVIIIMHFLFPLEESSCGREIGTKL